VLTLVIYKKSKSYYVNEGRSYKENRRKCSPIFPKLEKAPAQVSKAGREGEYPPPVAPPLERIAAIFPGKIVSDYSSPHFFGIPNETRILRQGSKMRILPTIF